jgi:hypothetical protein
MIEKMLRKALIKPVGRYLYLFSQGCGPGSALSGRLDPDPDPDPHYIEKLDPYFIKSRIRIHLKVKIQDGSGRSPLRRGGSK